VSTEHSPRKWLSGAIDKTPRGSISYEDQPNLYLTTQHGSDKETQNNRKKLN